MEGVGIYDSVSPISLNVLSTLFQLHGAVLNSLGWYQVRKALQARNADADFPPVNFKSFEAVYKALSEKLQPQVYELGFLKV